MCFKYGDVVRYKINNTKIWVCHKRVFLRGTMYGIPKTAPAQAWSWGYCSWP